MSFFYPSNLEELGGQIRCFEGFRRSKPIKSLWFSSQKHSSRRPVDPILIMYSWFFISPKYTYGKVMENHTYIYIYIFMYVYIYIHIIHTIYHVRSFTVLYIYRYLHIYYVCTYLICITYLRIYIVYICIHTVYIYNMIINIYY